MALAYDGRERIIDEGTGSTLRDAAGKLLGRYASRAEAMRALRDLRPPARAEDPQ